NDFYAISLIIFSISQTSSCPIEKGVIYTKWGTVSPGIIIAGVAAALETSNLPFQQIMSTMQIHQNKTESEIDYSSTVLSRNISNIWTSTVAGDLGEVVILQAVNPPIIGTPGTWNNTMLPRIFYLDDINYDFTRSELLGGIDGLILASKVASWTSILSRTRLSQILDMYYSPRGVSYNVSYKACKRRGLAKEQFDDSNFLKGQVSAIAKLLQEIGLSNQLLFENTIDNFTSVVVDTFLNNYEKAFEGYDKCDTERQLWSSLDVITIFDETWSEYELLKIIGLLVQELDVSYYGTHLGVIYGQSGTWMANVSESVLELFSQLNNFALTRSSSLSLHRSFESVVEYFQNRNYSDCNNNTGRKPRGFVIVVFAKSSLLTDEDLRWSQLSLNTIKASHPEVKLVYVTSDHNSASFETLANSYSGDIVLKTTVNDIESVVTEVSKKLANVPGHIIDIYCSKWHIAMEDYITPYKNTVYEISHEFIKRANFFVKFKGHNYGDFTVCAQDSNNGDKTCKRVVDNNVVNFTANDYCHSYNCNVQFSISEIQTRVKCTELDCRYPDQIRINIFTYWTSSSGSLTGSVTPFYCISFLLAAKCFFYC
ncbi:uncharacterized protein LOC108741255, partial [Agrilus planipennis]|uniref:Uncharacterized protein LOC108741255 n=1 Tax=Agrilus planipennis TaxID=224129 RepID=A0A1W4XGK8_AGRPL